MKPLKKHLEFAMLSLMAIAILTVSCKKTDPNAGLTSPRLFTPGGISIKTAPTAAIITWGASLFSTGQKLKYTTEFSQDSTFATSELSVVTDTTGTTVTESDIKIRKKYYMRVRANAYQDQPASNWARSGSFIISGEQLFYAIRPLELKETSVTFRWQITTGLTQIVLTPAAGTATNITLSASDVSTGIKTITGIAAGTVFSAELFAGTKSRGYLTFSTPVATVYTKVLNNGDNLATAIANAANNDIIGLNPGAYAAGMSAITQKTITIKSISGNPTDTKVTFKEFDLKGTGAGINFSGVELDGSTTGAAYFINPTGVLSDAEKCVFTQVNIFNCIIHDATTSFMRANRGSAGGDYQIDNITVRNSLIYNIATTNGYAFLHLDKLQFNTLLFSQNTMYNVGRQLISASTTLTTAPPTITFDYCTINSIGASSLYLIEGSANPIRFSLTNSIIANVPKPGGVTTGTVHYTATTSSAVWNNNDYFNFTNGSNVALTFPTTNFTMVGNQTINLGWTAATTDFTLPANSPLRNASNVSSPIGDPRWTY